MLIIIFYIVIVAILCYVMFTLGRIYELNLETQRIEEEIEEELVDQEMRRKKALEELWREEGLLE